MRKIHWKKLATRKLIFISGGCIVLSAIEHFVHLQSTSKGVEVFSTALLDHILFGIPFEGGR